jgi:ECF transporter S component (folate family)
MRKSHLQTMAFTALLISLEIVLSRFLSINTPIVKIGFGFVPIALCGMLFGPAAAAGAGALADLMGAMLFPVGPYFPGFTFTAALVGLVYGVFLHGRKGFVLPRVLAAAAIVSLPLHLGLNTLWIHLLYGKSFWVLLPTRVLQFVLMLPVQVAVLWVLSARLNVFRREQA